MGKGVWSECHHPLRHDLDQFLGVSLSATVGNPQATSF